MGGKLRVVAAAVVTAAGVLLGATEAKASMITFSYNTVFNGTTPTSTPPWLTAVFSDTMTPGTVQLKLTASLNVSSEFITDVVFNIDPFSTLTVTGGSYSGGSFSSSISTNNAQTLPGGGAAGLGFDLKFQAPSGPPAKRFNGTDMAIFTLSATGLTANSFFSTNSSGLYTGAHVQGIPVPGDGTTSGAITIPEPGTLVLLASGVFGLLWIRRYRRA